MTLPTSRRPPEVETWLEEESEKEQLILRIDRTKVFMDEMFCWYESLSTRQRRELTKKRIVRRALNASYRMDVDYRKLPSSWLRTFCDRYEIELDSSFGKMKYVKSSQENVKSNGSDFITKEAVKNDSVAEEPHFFEKKIIDLTKEPPPKEWLGPYLRGKVWPRRLCSHLNEDGVRVIFYDYEPTNQDLNSSNTPIVYPHDRDNVFPYI